MLMNTTRLTLFIGFIAISLSAFSQEKENALGVLITDRPDATESPNTVPVGYIQVETGTLFESFETNNIKTKGFTFNTTLLRIGLLDNLEFRLGWDFIEGTTHINGTKLNNVASGFNPLLLGAKVSIASENGYFPEIGLLGHLYLPFTASKDYKPETTGIDFRFSFAYTLSENSSLSYNIGAQWGGDSAEAALCLYHCLWYRFG